MYRGKLIDKLPEAKASMAMKNVLTYRCDKLLAVNVCKSIVKNYLMKTDSDTL